MQKIIFFDVDGTLINSQFIIERTTIECLKELKQKGYLLCIATGRSYDSLLRTPIIDIIDWDGIICNNGQLVLNEKQAIIKRYLIPYASAKEFIDMAKQLNYPVVVKCKKRFITQVADDNTRFVHRHFNNEVPTIGQLTNQEVEAMNIYAPRSYDYHDFTKIKGIDIIPCALDYAEVSPKGISKASSIQIVLDYYHLNEYIAFGDSPNDIEMLKHAKIAVAMGQSDNSVKQYASYITAGIDEGGIAQACHYLKL